MKFGFEQRWHCTPSAVADLYLSEDFWNSLDDLTKTSPPEVLEVTRKKKTAITRLRYSLNVDLPSEASRFIDPDDVTWVEQVEWNLKDLSAKVNFFPDQGSALMSASGEAVVFAEEDEAVRQIRGELKVRIPFLGKKVERAIIEGIGDHLEEEAAAAAEHLE